MVVPVWESVRVMVMRLVRCGCVWCTTFSHNGTWKERSYQWQQLVCWASPHACLRGKERRIMETRQMMLHKEGSKRDTNCVQYIFSCFTDRELFIFNKDCCRLNPYVLAALQFIYLTKNACYCFVLELGLDINQIIEKNGLQMGVLLLI